MRRMAVLISLIIVATLLTRWLPAEAAQTCFGQKATIADHTGNIAGTAGNDVIIGDAGDYLLIGGADADVLDGGPGDDLRAQDDLGGLAFPC